MLFMKCRELTFDENQSQLIDGVINTIMEFITEIKGYKFLVTNQKIINILLKAVNAQKEYNYQFRLVPDLIRQSLTSTLGTESHKQNRVQMTNRLLISKAYS
ncbi:Hypothetical_protein [Hexamita inflata]|uniref:Hypothetical_protein n=1 Tax=Hexamita inflata TaxID=28002 RepID=A0AA86NW32_9EUKA|nr:Hypothetical protein HINF_LOCUS14153 [Hexamita inflata]